MSYTIGIMHDTDKSLVEEYECDYCQGEKCAHCNMTGKVVFRNSKWEMSMSSGNFSTLFNALGLKADDFCGTFDAREILAALDRFNPELAVRAPHEENTPGQARIIHCGLDAEYVQIRTAKLREIALEAARREELVCWG